MTKMENLLKTLGKLAKCKGCGAIIYWLLTKNYKWMPVNPDGEFHWTTCPQASKFKKISKKRSKK